MACDRALSAWCGSSCGIETELPVQTYNSQSGSAEKTMSLGCGEWYCTVRSVIGTSRGLVCRIRLASNASNRESSRFWLRALTAVLCGVLATRLATSSGNVCAVALGRYSRV